MEFIPIGIAEELSLEIRRMDRQRREEELRLAVALLDSLSISKQCSPEEHDLLVTRLCSGDFIMTMPSTLRDKWAIIDGAEEILDRNRYINFVDGRILGNKFMIHPRNITNMHYSTADTTCYHNSKLVN